MKIFRKNGVEFSYTFLVKSGAPLSVKHEILQTENGFKTRLGITNTNNDDVYLEKAYPLCTDSLSIGSVPSEKWIILNQGRHKNDLPSVCIPGVRNGTFSDAVNRLSEEGRIIEQNENDNAELNGDQISVIRGGESSLAICFHSADIQLTEIIINIDKNGNVGLIRAGGDFNRVLKKGETVYSDWVCVDCQKNSMKAIDDYAAFVKESKGVRVSENKPAVYSTWYYYGKEINEQDVHTNIRCIKEKSLPFSHFQIDDGWEIQYGDWEANEKFPSGMKQIADNIKGCGMAAGIWTCPLIASKGSSLVKNHPEWLLKHTDGENCIFTMNKSDYYVLDCTNPAVIEWIEALYRKLAQWGYTYHKLDFTRAFPIQHNVKYNNPYISTVQAYVNAMKAVKRGIGENGYLLMCGGLYQPLVGITNGQRTGSDVKSMWLIDGKPKIPFTVKQNVLRYFMNEWWHNDPDSLMVRRNSESKRPALLDLGLLNDEEVKVFTLNQYAGGGLVGSTEALDSIDEERLMLLRHIMPVVNTKIIPTELFKAERYPCIVDVTVNKKWHTLCIFNWSDEIKHIKIKLDEKLLGNFLQKGKNYCVCEFFSGTVIKNASYGSTADLGEIPAHSAAVVKVAERDTPQIVRSNMHFSMGGEIEELKITGDMLSVRFESRYNYPVNYTVLLPQGYTAENKKDSIDISVKADKEVRLIYKLVKN